MLSKSTQAGRYSRRNKIKITTADKHFSNFIRLRDIVAEEYCVCITCGLLMHWKMEAQCGHYATRGHPMTRFNEQNAHAQCVGCNSFKGGEQAKHGFAIDRLYGDGTAEKLIALSEIRGQKIHTKEALKDIAKEYRLKAKEMAKQKGIEL